MSNSNIEQNLQQPPQAQQQATQNMEVENEEAQNQQLVEGQNREMEEEGKNSGENKEQVQPVIQKNQVEEYLEVADNKGVGQMIGNKEQFLKIFQQINKEKQNLKEQAKKLQKRKSMRKQNSDMKDPKVEASQTRKQNILKQIKPHIQKYKTMHCPNYSDTEVAKLRFQGKQSVFKYILYLAEQIKTIPETQLNEQQIILKNMSTDQLIKLAKTISIQIDVQFLNQLNSGNKQLVSKRYRSFWRNITMNIQDETNIELRKKIATRFWDAKKLLTLDQMDFYSPQKRQIVIRKNKRLMNQATAEDKVYPMQEDQNANNYQEKSLWTSKNVIEQKKPVYRHIDEGSLSMIKELISQEQINRMKKLLQEDLKGPMRQRLVGSIERVFQHKGQDQ